MVGEWLKVLSAPVTELFKGATATIDTLHTSEAEKMEAKRKLEELFLNARLELAKVDQQWAETQAGVIKAEANSQSWIARNWRPMLMLVFTYIVLHRYVLAPVLSIPQVEIPPEMWTLMNVGVGGYVGGRTVEKVVPAIAAVMAGKKK